MGLIRYTCIHYACIYQQTSLQKSFLSNKKKKKVPIEQLFFTMTLQSCGVKPSDEFENERYQIDQISLQVYVILLFLLYFSRDFLTISV